MRGGSTGLLGYRQVKFILLHLEHFGLSSSHWVKIRTRPNHKGAVDLRTLILRSLHFMQPYLDFLCGLRVLWPVPLLWEPVVSSIGSEICVTFGCSMLHLP